MTKKKWRRRTHGTSRQIGKAFPIDDSSEQSKKSRLPSVTSGVRASAEIKRLKEEYSDNPRKLDLIEEMEAEREEKEHRIPKSTTEKIKSVVNAVKPKPKPKEKMMVGGFPVDAPEEEKEGMEALPDEIRAEIKPIVAEAKSEGRSISRFLLNSRFERYMEKRAMMRKLRKEEKEREREHEKA